MMNDALASVFVPALVPSPKIRARCYIMSTKDHGLMRLLCLFPLLCLSEANTDGEQSDTCLLHRPPPIWSRIDALLRNHNAKKSGGIFLYERQAAMLTAMVKSEAEAFEDSGRGRYLVCETGFAAGHSATMFLSASENVDVLSFDLFDRPYQRPITQLIQETYPGRFKAIAGDSCASVPAYRKNLTNRRCDFLHGSSLCQTDNLDLVASADCGITLTSTAMNSLTDREVYFGERAQWTVLRAYKCMENIKCFAEKAVVLNYSMVFAKSGTEVKHKFCVATVSGRCSSSHGFGAHHAGDSRSRAAVEASSNDKICPRSAPVLPSICDHAYLPVPEPTAVELVTVLIKPMNVPKALLYTWLTKTVATFFCGRYRSLVSRVIVLWSNDDMLPPRLHGESILLKTHDFNFESNLQSKIRTKAVLLLDVDVFISEKGLRCLLEWWEKNPERIIGPFGEDLNAERDALVPSRSNGYRSISGRVLVFSDLHLQEYFKLPEGARNVTNLFRGDCDDVVLNLISYSVLKKKPLRVVLPPNSIVDLGKSCPGWAVKILATARLRQLGKNKCARMLEAKGWHYSDPVHEVGICNRWSQADVIRPEIALREASLRMTKVLRGKKNACRLI